MGPSTETARFDAAKLGGLRRGLPQISAPKRKKRSLAERLTSLRTSGAFGPKGRRR